MVIDGKYYDRDKFIGDDSEITFPQCNYCIHLKKFPLGTCTAFPERIPEDILDDYHDHREAYPSDNGIRFEQDPEMPILEFKLQTFQVH